jgi:antitoxin (DNA-binding transcriptional repressor) of toxin-antitoxin stability system
MRTVNIDEAKTQLSKLIEAVENGEEIVITRASRPVARLTRLQAPAARRQLGSLAGQLSIPDDFDAPLAEDVLALFLNAGPARAEFENPAPPRGAPISSTTRC